MKKYFLFVLSIAIIFSCSQDSESENAKPDLITGKAATRLYFSENNEYQRIGIVDLKKLNTFTTLLNYELNGLGVVSGIIINQRAKRLYIAESDDATIRRINLDSTIYRIVYYSDHDLVRPTSVAIDTIGKKLYWADSGTGQIMVGELFGTATDVKPTALYNGVEVIENCYGMAIDQTNNKIYFCDNTLHQILVGSLDGTGTPTILYDDFETIGCPAGLAISGDKIYWADDCHYNIVMASKDGSGSPSILFDEENDGVSFPSGLAIDNASKKIYWSEIDSSIIARGNLDGSGEKETILDGVQANSIALEF